MINKVIARTLEKPALSIKTQTLALALAVLSAVVVPQLFHLLGIVSGAGTSLGEMLLPMHLPIILTGLLAGPFSGAVAGFFGPLVSFAVTGMPSAAMLPFMMIELCMYGLSSGLLRNRKMPVFAKVLFSQVAGRAVRAVAILLAVYMFEKTGIGVAVIWKSITVGAFGIVLQWTLLPLLIFRVENIKKDEA